MSVGAMFSLWGVWAVAVVAPGPDVVVVLQRSFLDRRRGLAAGAGVVTGITAWIVAAFAGLSVVVATHPGLMLGLRLAGGLLLLWLGVSGLLAWRRSRSSEGAGTGAEEGTATASPQSSTAQAVTARCLRADYARGLLTNLSNPKALVFFGAVLAPFLTGSLPVAVSVLMVAVMVAMAGAWFSVLAVAASHPRVLRRIERRIPTLEMVCSVLFVVLGAAFVVSAVLAESGS